MAAGAKPPAAGVWLVPGQSWAASRPLADVTMPGRTLAFRWHQSKPVLHLWSSSSCPAHEPCASLASEAWHSFPSMPFPAPSFIKSYVVLSVAKAGTDGLNLTCGSWFWWWNHSGKIFSLALMALVSELQVSVQSMNQSASPDLCPPSRAGCRRGGQGVAHPSPVGSFFFISSLRIYIY